jgi:hypothetical protein
MGWLHVISFILLLLVNLIDFIWHTVIYNIILNVKKCLIKRRHANALKEEAKTIKNEVKQVEILVSEEVNAGFEEHKDEELNDFPLTNLNSRITLKKRVVEVKV